MNRRQFLRLLTGTPAAAAGALWGNRFGPRLSLAQGGSGRTLVVVFQRGGCDGLNTIVPYGDSDYYQLRPTIAVPPPDPSNPASAIDLDGFFGFHPGLEGFARIHAAGDLAIFPAVHYENATRSHFDGQRFIESGAPEKNRDGWLNRHLLTLPQPASMRAAGFGRELPHSLRGPEIVSAFADFSTFAPGVPEADAGAFLGDLSRLYGQTRESMLADRSLVLDHGRLLLNDLAIISGIDVTGYEPENGASYPDTPFGSELRHVAQLIKEGLGLEVAALSIPGWDTHAAQGGGESAGAQTRRHRDFADGIAAFYRDLGERMNDIVVLTMTEFGRTAAENGSGGTDHGHAAVWFALGGGVRGGIYGAWPGLSPENLVAGRYVAHTIDYRDVMAEILTGHLSNSDVATVLPGHIHEPVGFLSA